MEDEQVTPEQLAERRRMFEYPVDSFEVVQMMPARWKVMALTPAGGFNEFPKKPGVAMVRYPTGAMYCGEFSNGVPHGVGVLEKSVGLSIMACFGGHFENGQRKGFGQNFERFNAQAVECRKGIFVGPCQVEGTWSYGNALFEGKFHQDQPSEGKLTYFGGNYYVGKLLGYREHGKGSFHILKSGDVIQCDSWFRGRATGHVRYTWGCGNWMDTTYDNGKMAPEALVTYHDVHGWSFENEPFKNDIPVKGISCMAPQLVDCIKKGMCTFSFTGKARWGQLYFKRPTISEDGYAPSMQGYCMTCAKTCYPHHHSQKVFQLSYKWSGNFYCLCGSGEFDLPCFAKDAPDQDGQ